MITLREAAHLWKHHVWRRDCREVRGDGQHDDAPGVQYLVDNFDNVSFRPGTYRIGTTLHLDRPGLRLSGGRTVKP